MLINSPKAIPDAIIFIFSGSIDLVGGMLGWLIAATLTFIRERSMAWNCFNAISFSANPGIVAWFRWDFNFIISCWRAFSPYRNQIGNVLARTSILGSTCMFLNPDGFPLSLLKLLFFMPKFLAITKASEKSDTSFALFSFAAKRRLSILREILVISALVSKRTRSLISSYGDFWCMRWVEKAAHPLL